MTSTPAPEGNMIITSDWLSMYVGVYTVTPETKRTLINYRVIKSTRLQDTSNIPGKCWTLSDGLSK